MTDPRPGCPHPEKHAHKSKAAAIAARDSLERAKGIDLALKPYRCVCNAWHLGHPSTKPETRLRRALHAGKRNTRTARRQRKR